MVILFWNNRWKDPEVNIVLCRFLHNHGNIATEGTPKPGLCPTLISNDFKGSLKYTVQSTIGSTVHFIPFNSLEHCICTTTMTNIRPNRGSRLVPPGYKPQSIRMSHPTKNFKNKIISTFSYFHQKS